VPSLGAEGGKIILKAVGKDTEQTVVDYVIKTDVMGYLKNMKRH
jgi:hypothetical protein